MNYPYRIFVFMWLIVAVGLHATHTHAANTSLPDSLLTMTMFMNTPSRTSTRQYKS